jgi:DNA repair exonuclease SbcCD nuclease subunit
MADKGPSSRKDDWAETVFDKLSQVREIAREVKAAAILDGGDFFHIKAPGRNSHEIVRRTAEHHSDYPCPVYCTPGNHDCVYGDYAFLPQQPLGVLYAAGVFKRLYNEHEALFEENGVRVRVVGVPYPGNKYDPDKFRSIKRGDEDVLICVAHVLASLGGGSMFEGEDIFRYGDLLETAPDVFCFGHWHMDQGVEILGGKTFINIGALTRGSLSQDEVQRRPACAVLECTKSGVSVDVRRLRVKPPEEAFDVDARNRQVRRQVEMDAFVNKIREGLQPKAEGVTLQDALGSVSGVPDDVRERALAYLEQV